MFSVEFPNEGDAIFLAVFFYSSHSQIPNVALERECSMVTVGIFGNNQMEAEKLNLGIFEHA